MRSGSRISVVLFAGIALGITALLTLDSSAQQPAPPPPQFRTTTDLVVVDVSVLDRNRRPVRGLTAADFTVVEDGAPQPIAAFQPIEAPQADIPSAKWMGRTTLDVQSNETPNGRLVLIYLDERTESADPFFFQKAKKLGHAIVDQLAPNDVAAVAFVLDHRGAQEFTTDRGRLHQAVDTFAPSGYVDVRVERTLTELARQFGAIPERRKVIMYIGSGEPFNMEVLTAMELVTAQAQPVGKSGVPPPPLDVPATLRTAQQRDLYDGLMTLTQAAQRANVSIYAFDPIGLAVESSSSDAGADIETQARNDFLRMLAAISGGRAVVNHNAPEAEVPAVLRENSAYYLIGFRPADPKLEGRFHRIQVKVNRPNLEVRARRGYVEDKAGSTVAQTAPTARRGRIIPASDVAVKLSAIPIGPDGQGSNNIALAIRATLPSREVQGTEHVSISYSILDMGGAERASGRRSFAATTPAGLGNGALVQTLVLEHLPPGKYDVRVSAEAQETARRGELIGDVTVPDFRKETLSASGVVVEEFPAPNMVPTDALAGVLSGVPTLSRVFSSASHVEASLRLYQAGGVPAGVKVTASILDGRDRVAFESTEVLDGSRFTDGFAQYKLPLPLSKLIPGFYLLRFDASRSSSLVVRREVQFEVK